MRILFVFLDGIGLGVDNPATNPFARARLPTIERLLGGRKLLASSAPTVGNRATLLALDATLGVQGLPQSATGQAVLLTGINIPAQIGEHYGPKPNQAVTDFLLNGNLFSDLKKAGRSVALLNAYPPRYFRAVSSGHRLYSSIPLAVTSAGVPLFDEVDYIAGRAASADFTGRAWVDMLGYPDAPIRTPYAAGRLLAQLAGEYDFSLFEYWSTDYAGHKQDMPWAIEQLETFDGVLAGLLSASDDEQLILITSDHGNMEDLSTRRHTDADVPALIIGPASARAAFSSGLTELTGIAPAIRRSLVSAQ
ncbi:MAG: alkaline phosphatase family protein [Chloroflexota bacterium]